MSIDKIPIAIANGRPMFTFASPACTRCVIIRKAGTDSMTLSNGLRNWAFAQVIVIDDDLGLSGRQQESDRLRRLLTAVGEGRAGAVLALEASRLARNNRASLD
jgi:DNA invertase Pin-like site-specific DNA recombinase